MKQCPDGKILNTKTNRCIKIKEIKKCPDGKILNTKTNRCIKIKNDNKINKIDYIKMKTDLINNFKIIRDFEKNNGNHFKEKAYDKAINIIELFDKNLTMENIKELKGIGEKNMEKIKEFITTNKIQKVIEIENDPKYILYKNLPKIYGIGPAKIKEIKSKIHKFEDLYLDENKKLFNSKQLIGLKYFNDLEKRIPYSEGTKHNEIITNTIKKIDDKIEFDMVGSFRRKSTDMGDIDILIKDTGNIKLNDIINKLIENNYIIETLANGKKKFMGICKIDNLPARRIDILLTNEKHYYYTLLYFTGSYTFNIEMRRKALEKGLSLSEYGYTDMKTKKLLEYDIKSEKDIFDIIELKYVKPENRI